MRWEGGGVEYPKRKEEMSCHKKNKTSRQWGETSKRLLLVTLL